MKDMIAVCEIAREITPDLALTSDGLREAFEQILREKIDEQRFADLCDLFF